MHESEKWKWSHSVVSDSKRSHGLQPTRLLCPWDFPGKSTGVGCHCLLHKWNYIQVILWNQKIRKYCFNLQAMEANTGGNWHGSKGLKDHLSQGWRGSTKWQGEIELGYIFWLTQKVTVKLILPSEDFTPKSFHLNYLGSAIILETHNLLASPRLGLRNWK